MKARGILAASMLVSAAAYAAEPIKVGTVTVASFAPVFIAEARGYFAAEGLAAEVVPFDAAQPVAVAVVSGALDFGVAALTAGFYNLAGQGGLRIIGGAAHETPGFHNQAFIASARADAAGLRSLKDMPGHSMGVTGMGAPPVYVLGGLVGPKYGFALKAVRLVAMQSIPNLITAVTGNQIDATASAMTGGLSHEIAGGELKLLAWVGDETPWQFGAAFAATRTADERPDTVRRFLRAYGKGAHDYFAAFARPDGTRADGLTAPEVMAIIAKATGQSLSDVALGIPYNDADERLDVRDILRQVAWYRSEGLVKPGVDGEAIIDRRYVVPLPEN